jgi:CDGSH-type Zn-finger protein
MRNVTRPLGEALTKMPVCHDPSLAGMTAGPGFGITRDVHLLPHKRSAWTFFGERLHELATVATKLLATRADQLPPDVEEAVAGLQALSLEFAPADRSWNAEAELGEFRSLEAGQEPGIKPAVNGPLLVKNVERFTNAKGEALPTSPEMALCRCGGSKNKPFCDGTHARRGFTSERGPKHTPDGVKDFPGEEITVHFNKLQCSAAGECAAGLPSVFHHGGVVRIATGQPWIQPDREDAEQIIDVIRRCPSGALRYTWKGETGPGHTEPPGIRIRRDGPYEVEGEIPLRTSFWCEGATRQIYALCRCGASRNKPFCDGSHFRVKFKDEKN